MQKRNYSIRRSTIEQYIRLAARANAPIFLTTDVDVRRLEAFCSRQGLTYTPVLMKVASQVFQTHPVMNAILARDIFLRRRIFIPEDVDIALAIEKTYNNETFITTPVLRKINAKSIGDIDAEIRALARTPYPQLPQIKPIMLFNHLPGFLKYQLLKYISQSAYLFKTFFGTVGFTNIGKFGVKYFLPLWMNTIVFGIGSIEQKPVVTNGRVEAAPVLALSMCFNHSVLDGGEAGQILSEVKNHVESGRFMDEETIPQQPAG